jgi:hypothetical protein
MLLSTLLTDTPTKDSILSEQSLGLRTHKNWQISLRMNFLAQAHRTLLLRYALDEAGSGSSTDTHPSTPHKVTSPKVHQRKQKQSNHNNSKKRGSKRIVSGVSSTDDNEDARSNGTDSDVDVMEASKQALCTPGYIDSFVIEDSLPTTQVCVNVDELCLIAQ